METEGLAQKPMCSKWSGSVTLAEKPVLCLCVIVTWLCVAFQGKDPLEDRQGLTTHFSIENDLAFTDEVDYWKGYSRVPGV